MAIDKILGVIRRDEPGLLQNIIDSFKGDTPSSPTGGILRLGRGHFYGNLNLNYSSTVIEGEGDGTVIHGSITSAQNNLVLRRMTILGDGQPYALKLYNPGSYLTRCQIEHCVIGPSFLGTGTGPVRVGGVGGHGVWLDGALLCDFVKCTFAGNPGSNVFLDTTDTQGTNVNRFQSCTSNTSGRYGYEILGGTVGGVHILGGNVEDNALGSVTAQSMNDIHLEGVDFENSIDGIQDMVGIFTCNPARIVNCNFISFAAVQPIRAFQFAGCQGALVSGSRFSGMAAGGIGIFDPNTVGIIDPSNVIADPSDRIFMHRGRLPQ